MFFFHFLKFKAMLKPKTLFIKLNLTRKFNLELIGIIFSPIEVMVFELQLKNSIRLQCIQVVFFIFFCCNSKSIILIRLKMVAINSKLNVTFRRGLITEYLDFNRALNPKKYQTIAKISIFGHFYSEKKKQSCKIMCKNKKDHL